MEHTDIQQAMYPRWTIEAYIDGQRVSVPGGLPARTLSSLRQRDTCTLAVTGLPATGKKQVMIIIILNDWLSTRFFTGYTSQHSLTYTSFSRSVALVDMLDLDRTVPTKITWNNTNWLTAVLAILTAAEIPQTMIEVIYEPTSTFKLGPVYPVIIEKTESLQSVFTDLLDFAGAAVYISPSGSIRVVDGSGIPMSTSTIVYAHAPNLSAGEFGVIDAGLTIEGDETLTNSFTATGPKTPTGAIPDATYTASGVIGKPQSRQYRFAQSDATCQAIASRELSRNARNRRNIWFSAPLNPCLLPGTTILFRFPALGMTVNTPAYVAEVTTSEDASMRVAIVTGPSLVDGYNTSIAAPVADFSMMVEHQTITLAGVPVMGYLVQCKDSSHDKAGYAIISRSWEATGPGATPTSFSWTQSVPEPTPKPDHYEQAIFLFTSLVGASIKLRVGSKSGEEAERTHTPTASTIEIFTRTVSVAAVEGWYVLIKSGWQAFETAGACTAVPPIAESGVLWAGFSSGALYKSLDALQTTPTLVCTFVGSIGCIWVNETDPLMILVGHGA